MANTASIPVTIEVAHTDLIGDVTRAEAIMVFFRELGWTFSIEIDSLPVPVSLSVESPMGTMRVGGRTISDTLETAARWLGALDDDDT